MTKFLNISTDNTLGGSSPSDEIVSSQKAIKEYVDSHGGGGATWGNITGTLSDQTDLQNALKALVPVSTMFPFAGTTAPTGFLLCDGSEVSRTTYADLFAAIGTTYGAGDGSTTFNVPSLVNRVPMYRIDADPVALGTITAGRLPNITGSLLFGTGSGSSAFSALRGASGAFAATDTYSRVPQMSSSTGLTSYNKTDISASRSSNIYNSNNTSVMPRNVATLYIIKY